MTFLDTVVSTFNTAVDTVSCVAQTIVEKNRVNAKLNRLRLVMKNESELMNRAYIALGKLTYEAAKSGEEISAVEQKKLLGLIDVSKKKIAKVRECYKKIVDSQNDAFYGVPEVKAEYDSSEVVDITVACSNESDYQTSPFEDAKKEIAEVAEKVEETAEDIKEAVEEKVEQVLAEAEEKPAEEKAEFVDEAEDSELF